MNNPTPTKTFHQKYQDIMPEGAGVLFFTQMFATLAFSVFYSTLILYMTNSLKLNNTIATSITASFIAFNYALHLFGGYIGGRFLSYRNLFTVATISQSVGCILISIPTINSLYWGLAAFLIGSGLCFTCINCMLTQFFHPNDKRREAAFLWNYSGMNIGFFVGFSISGYFQLHNAYHGLFLLASLGGLISIIIAASRWKSLYDRNTIFIDSSPSQQFMRSLIGIILFIFFILILRWLLENSRMSNHLIMGAGIMMVLVIAILAMRQKQREECKKMWAYLILAFTALVFWTLYQIAPMGLTLFIEHNVDRHLLGFLIPPQWVLNINTIVIIIGGPLLSVIFNSLRARDVKLTIPIQFSIALLLIGLAFVILPIGIYFADAKGYLSFNWILLCYILQSIGELFLAPIGYAMVGQLAPVRLQGLLMGAWMMTTGVAATLSGYFSHMALGQTQSTNPLITNPSFSHTFSLLGWFTISVGVLLLLLTPLLLRLTYEKKLNVKNYAPGAQQQ